MSDRFRHWKKPIFESDWKELERRALSLAQKTGENYRNAKAADAPDWFIERMARCHYAARRRYWRIKAGNDRRLRHAMEWMLRELNLTGSDDR